MVTKAGYIIENFEILEKPIDRNNLEPHIYWGLVKQVPLPAENEKEKKFEDIEITWDKFGRCSNLKRTDCFIDVDKI